MIEARGLTKRYGTGTLALDDLSFRVEPKEAYGLLGGAGAGKTTAIDAFCSATLPTAGQALIAGIDVVRRPTEAKNQATFVTPKASLYGSLTARRNVEFFVTLAGCAEALQARAVENALRWAGVPDRNFDAPVRMLSRGQSILVWLSIALLRDTPALVLDEPTLGLDARDSAEIRECLMDLKNRGKAMLVATSDVSFATAIADRVGILAAGRKIAERTSREILDQNLSQFYVEYAGPLLSKGPPWSSGSS